MLDQEQIDIIRENFKDESKEIKLSDEVLSLAVEKYGLEKFDGLSFEDQAKFIEQAENAVAKVSISDPGISNLVKKIDPAFETELANCIEAVVKGKTTAVDIYAQFKRVYTLDEMNKMPVPNTEAEHVSANQKPDKVKTKDVTGKPITIVWTNDFVSAMSRGREYENVIDEVKKEIKTVGSVPRFQGKGTAELAGILSDATARRNALRSMVKRAISLHHQLEALSSMPLVEWQWIEGTNDKSVLIPSKFGIQTLDKDKELIKATLAPRPIWIYPKGNAGKGRDFSVTQVLAFDIPAALKGKGGGTMADLTDTAGRGTQVETGDTDGTGEDMPLEAAETTLSGLVHFFNKRENMAIVRKIVADKKHKDRNDWLDNIGTLYLLLKPIYDANKTAYDNLQNKEDETPNDRQVA